MTKDELTTWALKTGWKTIAGHPSLTKPNRPNDPIVRLVLKATVANVEIRKPAGKWEKVSGAAYSAIAADEDGGLPSGLGLESLTALAKLIQDNRDAMVFAR